MPRSRNGAGSGSRINNSGFTTLQYYSTLTLDFTFLTMFGLDTALILSKTAAMSVNFGTVENVRLAERKKKTINIYLANQ